MISGLMIVGLRALNRKIVNLKSTDHRWIVDLKFQILNAGLLRNQLSTTRPSSNVM